MRVTTHTTTLATALLATVVLAGPGLAPAATADATPAAPATTVAPALAGSYVAVVSRGKRTGYGLWTQQQTLEVISPTGEQRALLTVKVRRSGAGSVTLADVSADGATALLTTTEGKRNTVTRAIGVDLATGAQRSVVVSSDYTVSFLAPDGNGVVVTGYGDKGFPVARVGWDGVLTPYPSVIGGRLILVDPTTVLGQTAGRRQQSVDVISLTTGTLTHRWATPGLKCDPVRTVAPTTGTATSVLLACYTEKSLEVLRTIDPATGVVGVVTDRHPKSKKYYGDLDARLLGGTLYVQAAGPCGYVDVARQESTGRLVHVKVPGAKGSVLLVGTVGSELVLRHAQSCDGGNPRTVLTRFDPATGAETPIVTLPGKETFDRIVPAGETQAALL